jgi:hypothetical protein
MKKLNLKNLGISDGQVLTRGQLKRVLGGYNFSTLTGCATTTACYNSDACTVDSKCRSCMNVGGSPTSPGECGWDGTGTPP